MLLRQLPAPKPADRLQLVKQSVDLANEAVKVDVKDGLSWYCLGESYFNQVLLVHYF